MVDLLYMFGLLCAVLLGLFIAFAPVLIILTIISCIIGALLPKE